MIKLNILKLIRYLSLGTLVFLYLAGTQLSVFNDVFLDFIGMTHDEWSSYFVFFFVGAFVLLFLTFVYSGIVKHTLREEKRELELNAYKQKHNRVKDNA